MSKTIIKKRSKQKEIDPKFGVSEWDPAELDVRHTRHGKYESRPPPRGGTWREQIKEEAYKLRQKQREADSPEFISPHSTTDTMDTDEAQEVNKQIMEKIEKEPEGAEYLNVIGEGKYENVGEALDTGATFSTVTEMQVEAEKAQQTYEEIESLEDSHIVSFPKLDKEKEALRRKTQGERVPFETEDLMTSLANITEPPPIAFTDPSDFDEVLREGDEYLSKIEEELGNEGGKQVLSRIEKGFAKTVKWEAINFPMQQLMKYHLRLPFPHAPKVLSRNPRMWVDKTPILEHPAVLITIPEWESKYRTKSYAVDVKEGYIYAVRSEDWERLVERAYVATDEPLEMSQITPAEREMVSGKVQTLDSKERVPLAESTRKDFKEAYAIYMSVKKLPYYLQDADIILRSDHLPLKKFLSKNTLNTKVNNWAIEISPYRIQFEYIKGIKNTLADTMSRLIKITPEIELEPEPTGQEYGYEVFEELQPIETTTCHISELKEENQKKKDPIPEDVKPIIDLTEEQLEDIQMKDKFIKNLVNRIVSGKQPSGKPYYLEGRLLKKYIYDNKQRFEVTVVPPNCAAMLLNLAHDQMGHNGSARTYMLLKRLYYWKGMKTDINIYVKQCKLCQKQNIVPVKYSQGHFSAPMTPMEFISMDLIGDFVPSSKGNKYALTVICMLTGYTFCIPIPSKKASDVVTAYVDNVYAKFCGSKKILSDNGTEFKNQLFEKVAKELGVEFKCYTAPYHPQSNGRIEGFHHFLKACMSKHISKTMEWDEVVHLATAAYNFFPNEHSRESPFFLMFGRDPRIPLNTLLEPKIRYMGTDENILSLEALQRIYYMVAENLKLARERQTKQKSYHPVKLKTEDMVMIKTHADGQFQPIYKGYYRIVSFKGNQVQVIPCEGGKPHYVHITDVKYVLPADSVISHIPTFNQFGRKTKLNLNPDTVPNLNWKVSTTLNTKTPIIPIKIENINTQTTQLIVK